MFALSGCSALKLGYQQGDRLAYWWVDHYVDVNDAQAAPTREAIARFFAWHRKEQLPEIVSLLAQAKAQVQQNVDVAGLARLQQDSQRLAREAYERALPDVADLVLSLDTRQIARMQAKLAEGNEKYRKKFLGGSADDREDARFDKVMEYAKLIYGRFSDTQEAAIRGAMAPLVAGAQARYAERLARQQEWLALVRRAQAEHPPRAQLIVWLKRYGEHWQTAPDAERESRRQAYNDAGLALAATIAGLATPEQRRHAVERLQGWIDDAQALQREGARVVPRQAAN
ncbi:hypothetical protein BKK79_09245 [Cupriavidus sp. USMAA2-4]|uniref:DUF6279 family lipoprotein n=1 Tax=Cupriavidus sp. USMAA2-4 TaxID=876364 RepID=UPI0008A6E84D|nr:DUF6279 family lipoprotein [Cupriavidus sp. USMAA2-4]AOY91958.1 hypothetical protein BKK79_09245 [Cupriavidus sp. USMAA2-4]